MGAQTTFELVVSESVKATSLDKAALKDLLLGKTPYWDGGQPVEIVILSDKTEPALKEITGMSGSQFKTHWQRLTFSGRGKDAQGGRQRRQGARYRRGGAKGRSRSSPSARPPQAARRSTCSKGLAGSFDPALTRDGELLGGRLAPPTQELTFPRLG